MQILNDAIDDELVLFYGEGKAGNVLALVVCGHWKPIFLVFALDDENFRGYCCLV